MWNYLFWWELQFAGTTLADSTRRNYVHVTFPPDEYYAHPDDDVLED